MAAAILAMSDDFAVVHLDPGRELIGEAEPIGATKFV
jgi:hypothetical protein